MFSLNLTADTLTFNSIFTYLFPLMILQSNATTTTTIEHSSERQKIADKMREGFLTVSLKDLLVLPRLLKRIPEMTTYEQAKAVVGISSKPLSMIIEALGQENRLNRIERASKLSTESKLFFQKVGKNFNLTTPSHFSSKNKRRIA
jgi:hypothetical protein